MDNIKGISVGVLYFLIFFAVYFSVSLPLYALVIWIFGDVNFSDRWLSAIPYLGIRGMQVGASAIAAVYSAVWVCGRFLNVRSAPIALGTFIVVAIIWNGAGLIIESKKSDFDPHEIVFVPILILIGYFLGKELIAKSIVRFDQRK